MSKYRVLVLNQTGQPLDFTEDVKYWKTNKLGVTLDVEYTFQTSDIPFKMSKKVKNGKELYRVDAEDLAPKIRKLVKEGEYDEVIFAYNNPLIGKDVRSNTPYTVAYPKTALVTLEYKSKDLWESVNHERFHALERRLWNIGIYIHDVMDETFGKPYYKNNDIYSTKGNRAETIKLFKPFWGVMFAKKEKPINTLQHLVLAIQLKGTKEFDGTANNPVILKWAKELGIPYTSDSTAWCSLYVNYVCMKNGLPYTKKLNARSWLDVGKKVTVPRAGDVCIFWRVHKDSWEGHVGFYMVGDDKQIAVLGGNQDNEVSIKFYDASKLLGFRRLL